MHELGHLLGLDDSCSVLAAVADPRGRPHCGAATDDVRESLMNPVHAAQRRAVLGAPERAFLCEVEEE